MKIRIPSKQILTRFMVIFFLVLVPISAIGPQQVSASHAQAHTCALPPNDPQVLYNRDELCGYFRNLPYLETTGNDGVGLLTGLTQPCTNPWQNALLGVNNVDQFVCAIRFNLLLPSVFRATNQCAAPPAAEAQRRNSAAFIVMTMLGQGNANGGNNAAAACNLFPTWEARVRQYAAEGLINFNHFRSFQQNTLFHTSTQDPNWYHNSTISHIPGDTQWTNSISFYSPSGAVLYSIKKDCANPIGVPGSLTQLSHGFNVNPNASVTFSPTQDAPTNVTFGTGASYSGSPSITTYDRKYYYIKAGTTTEVTLQDPPPVSRTNNGTSATFGPVNLSLVGLGLDAGDRVCARNTVTPAAGTADPSGDVLSVTVASRSANVCETIVHIPYHQVFGDTRAGSGFLTDAGSCAAATDTTARIIGHNRDGAPDFTGAGSQLAAYTFNSIAFFASGQLRPSVTTNAKALTFANVNPSRSNLGASGYGGGLMDGQSVCAPDHYDDGVGEANQTVGASTGANIAEGVYSRTGNLIITGGNLGLGTGSRVIYVDGDVRITGNITYAGGNYNSIDQVPGFRLIVEGNIYVEPGVSQLDGIYVAQPHPDGTEGRFYTCAPGGAPPDAGEMNGVCRSNKLTVYGAVLADLIKLTRSGSTVSQSVNNSAHTPSQSAAASTAAEVIVLTPEAWLVSDFTGGGEFDSITTLPPVL
jgi:hypothetical protein